MQPQQRKRLSMSTGPKDAPRRARTRSPYLRAVPGVLVRCEKCGEAVANILPIDPLGEHMVLLSHYRIYRLDLPEAGQPVPRTVCGCEVEWTLDRKKLILVGSRRPVGRAVVSEVVATETE